VNNGHNVVVAAAAFSFVFACEKIHVLTLARFVSDIAIFPTN